MQNAAVVGDRDFCAEPVVRGARQMPLPFMRAGESANIVKVRGKDDVHHHLENLGFVVGAPIRVVAEHSGDLIVEIKGSQVALDRSVAAKIVAA